MKDMKELGQALDEMAACGKGLIRAAEAIRGIFEGQAQEPKPGGAEAPPEADAPGAPGQEPEERYTFAEVRKAFSAKSRAGHTEQVRALINSYGADRLSAVKEEDYPRLMEDLEAIV